ncbi:hypothetical protein C8R47DRAFT_696760 [Mycena vitilis]|nr:hypothetical protein C8R47DRAFT_696760 [Mycena vitilis]
MSETLRPWITDHLIRVAETYGANLTAVPVEAKGKRVQILEFLTHGAENEDCAIWALIHDQKLIVPVKFTKEAVMEWNKAFGRRFTDHKTAVVTIKKFRPMSTRIPLRNGGMSSESHLALLCESVSMVGSLGGSKLGSPKDLDSNTDLREWSQALRQDGGAGNVLKDRKKAREGNNTPAKHMSPRKPSPTKRIPHVIESVEEYNMRWKVCTISLPCSDAHISRTHY